MTVLFEGLCITSHDPLRELQPPLFDAQHLLPRPAHIIPVLRTHTRLRISSRPAKDSSRATQKHSPTSTSAPRKLRPRWIHYGGVRGESSSQPGRAPK